MSSCPEPRKTPIRLRRAWLAFAAAAAWVACVDVAAQAAGPAAVTVRDYAGIGRAATPKELAAWDIDVRPDFKGLPKGSGSVAAGQDVWEAKCASCHGIFGESNEVFTPLVGGTTKEDVVTGRVARLTDRAYPQRTTLMKVSSVSTLWDYINRAMPWTQPKSLKPDEVYAVVAYLLNMGEVLPGDFVLSDRNIADAQARLPNHNGKTTDHALWPGRGIGRPGQPDVRAVACMKDCGEEPKVASFVPDYARDAHGNLAEQNRLVGAQKGMDTSGTARAGKDAAAAARKEPAVSAADAAAVALTQQHACVACHSVDSRLVGPSFRDVAKKYGSRADAVAYLTGKIRSGGSGLWGAIPMPAQTLPEPEARAIAQWLSDGAKK